MAAVRCGKPLLWTGSVSPSLVVGRAGTGGASPLGRLAKALGQKRSARRALAGRGSRPVGAEEDRQSLHPQARRTVSWIRILTYGLRCEMGHLARTNELAFWYA